MSSWLAAGEEQVVYEKTLTFQRLADTTPCDIQVIGFLTQFSLQFFGYWVKLLRYALVVLCLEHSRILKEGPWNRIRSISAESRGDRALFSYA